MAKETHVSAQENGQSAFAVDIEVGTHLLRGDEPAAMGGGDLGPAPFDLLTAALAECTAMTVRWYARKHAIPLDRVRVEVVHQARQEPTAEGKSDAFSKKVVLDGSRLSDQQRAKLIEVAAKCPVQRTLERGSVISTRF